jgi:hypothetical protein
MVRNRMEGGVRFGRDADRVRYTTLLRVAAGLADPSETTQVCRPVTPLADNVEALPRRRTNDSEPRNRRATDTETRRRRASDKEARNRRTTDAPLPGSLRLVSNGQPE